MLTNTNEEISWLKDLLKIDTTNNHEKKTSDYLEALLKSHGIKSKQIEYSTGRNQLVVVFEGQDKGKTLGFSGHMDVVPVGDVEWKHPPFAAEEENGKIYARGASDMKGGVMAAVAALIRLKKSNTPLKGNIKLLITVGEETGAVGARQLTQLGYADDLDALVIGEPSQNNICYAHKGAFWLRINTYGHTAHGSMPQAGVNAINHMVAFINALHTEIDFGQYKDSLLGESTSSINTISGGKGTNVVPDKCSIEIDIRTVPSEDHDLLLQQFDALIKKLSLQIPKFKADIEIVNDQMSVHTSPDDPFIAISKAAIIQTTGKDPMLLASPGYTDASQFTKAKNKYPILIIGPGGMDQAHQPDEQIVIQDYLDSIDIYVEIAKNFLI